MRMLKVMEAIIVITQVIDDINQDLRTRLRHVSPSIRQPSLKMVDQIYEKSERLFVEFHEYCSCALVSYLPPKSMILSLSAHTFETVDFPVLTLEHPCWGLCQK